MTRRRLTALALGALAGTGLLALACAARTLLPAAEAAPSGASGAAIHPTSAPPPPAPDPAAVPVLVELFTSEGCSSCPPADAVLARLERTQPVAGARVVPLGLHVDYWDRLGWTDPFSSASASERQRAYASLGSGSYTPQAVIDGRAETVGSRAAAVERAIVEAAKRPHASIVVDVAPAAAEAAPRGRTFDLAIAVGALPPGAAADAELVVAVTRGGARVDVPRGENAGATLEHTAIARELRTVGKVPAGGTKTRASASVPDGGASEDHRVVVFVQERASRRVLGAATRGLGNAKP